MLCCWRSGSPARAARSWPWSGPPVSCRSFCSPPMPPLSCPSRFALGLASGQISRRFGLRRLSGRRLHRRHVARAWPAHGYWVNSYLLGIPLLLLHFAAVYGFSVLLAVLTRNTLACLIGSVAFWFLCWGINYGRHCLVALQSVLPPLHPALRGLAEAGYWILPKPVDLGMILQASWTLPRFFPFLARVGKSSGDGRACSGVFLVDLALFCRRHDRPGRPPVGRHGL